MIKCPYCGFEFHVLAVGNTDRTSKYDGIAPAVCEKCGEISLLIGSTFRQVTAEELEAIKKSPAYKEFLGPAQKIIKSKGN